MSPKKRKPPMSQALNDSDVEIEDFILNTLGGTPDVDVAGSVIDGEILLDLVAPQITVTVHDQDRRLQRSEALWDSKGRLRAIDVKFDGLMWRLMSFDKHGDDFTLVLELRHVARLRTKFGPRKAASRAKVTRAQYILTLVRSIEKRIPVVVPELTKKQPNLKPKLSKRQRRKKSKQERDENRESGFDEGASAAGLDKAQMERVAICLEESEDHKSATDRVKLAMLVAMAGESTFGSDTGARGTTFQTTQISESELATQARHFIIGGRSFRAGGAIGYAKAHPNATVGEIASKVEVSDKGAAHYNKHRGKARRILSAWYGGDGTFEFDETGGGGGGSSSSVTAYKRYEYKVEKEESYWDAVQRLAEQVRWRAFFSVKSGKATFYYISEKRLFKSRAVYRVSEDTDGVSNIDYSQNYRKRAQKAVVYCRIDRWLAPPGTIVVIDDLNPEGSQRWLVESIRRSMFSPEAEITCKRPMDSRREPATETYEKDVGEDGEPDEGRVSKRGSVKGFPESLTDDMLRFMQEVAGETQEEIFVWDNKKHSRWTVDGNESNHWSGNAADVNVGGDARTMSSAGRKGDNIVIAAFVVMGYSRSEARKMIGTGRTNFQIDSTWRGHTIEVGWRTDEGGNHWNHVHFGISSRGARAQKPTWTRKNP